VSTPLQLLVHFVEEHVGEQRRQGTPLRSALLPLHHYPVHHYPGVEIAADQPQHPPVPYPLGKLAHEHVVVDPVEEPLQVYVHHKAPAFLDEATRRRHRLVRAPPRAEAVAVLRETHVESGLQDL
jgi:hypothetical protein